MVIAAITSCTNTSNLSVMLAAGWGEKAMERGLTVKPWVKTSLAPGSKVVMDYYREAGLIEYLERLGFTWWDSAAPPASETADAARPVAQAVENNNLIVAAVLSGNRNFEGRVNRCEGNYLASPPLVVAYALAGTVDVDLVHDPLAPIARARPSTFATSGLQIRRCRTHACGVNRGMFEHDTRTPPMATPTGRDEGPDRRHLRMGDSSTYIKKPPYFEKKVDPATSIHDFAGLRVLAMLGDSVTTDHISPAGRLQGTPAGRYLRRKAWRRRISTSTARAAAITR